MSDASFRAAVRPMSRSAWPAWARPSGCSPRSATTPSGTSCATTSTPTASTSRCLSDPARQTSSAEARIGADGAATYVFDLRWNAPGTDRAVPSGARHVHTGSIGALLPPGGRKVPGWVESARSTCTVSYDPNVRPALMGSAENARAKVERLVGLSDVVKASDEDLAWLAPGVEPAEVAAAWLELGPGLVVVTRGEQGAIAACRAGTFEVPPIEVEVADTVGAGDAFMAGLLDGLRIADLIGADRREALRLGLRRSGDPVADARRPRVGIHLPAARGQPARPCTSSRPGRRRGRSPSGCRVNLTTSERSARAALA